MNDIQVDMDAAVANAAVAGLALALAGQTLKRNAGTAAAVYTQAYLRGLPSNKQGWPSQGFYGSAADGTAWEATADGFVIHVDNEKAPGALKHQYNRGDAGRTRIDMNDKLLAIPARQEFYGTSPGQYANLRFGMFHSGAKFLYIGQGGADRVNFQTGDSHSNQRGIGARSAMMIAFWLKESVEQDAKPGVLPTKEQYSAVVTEAVSDFVTEWRKKYLSGSGSAN